MQKRTTSILCLLCALALPAGTLPIRAIPAKAADPRVNNVGVSRIDSSPGPKSEQSGFSDVGASAFCARAVVRAVENEISNGMSEASFAPDAACTRGQSAAFLCRATDQMQSEIADK